MKDYMSKINFSSQQLLGLINDILEISKLEKGKITLDTRHFDLKKCITDCADMVRDQIKREGKTFTLDFDIKTREVYGDSFRVTPDPQQSSVQRGEIHLGGGMHFTESDGKAEQ